MVEQVSVFLQNERGRLAEVCRALGDGGFNMRALMVADTAEYGVARILCDRPRAARSALEAAGFGASLAEVVAVVVPDRPGGLADVLEQLGTRGVDVEYAYCFVEPEGDSAVDIFRVDDPEIARRALSDADVRTLDAADLYEPDAAG